MPFVYWYEKHSKIYKNTFEQIFSRIFRTHLFFYFFPKKTRQPATSRSVYCFPHRCWWCWPLPTCPASREVPQVFQSQVRPTPSMPASWTSAVSAAAAGPASVVPAERLAVSASSPGSPVWRGFPVRGWLPGGGGRGSGCGGVVRGCGSDWSRRGVPTNGIGGGGCPAGRCQCTCTGTAECWALERKDGGCRTFLKV